MRAVWKIPRNWRPGLADRTALYPALHLRWAGWDVLISEDPPAGAWACADVRTLVVDGPMTEEDRDLVARAAERGPPPAIASQTGIGDADRAFAAAHGARLTAWRDPGPLSSPPPRRAGERMLVATASPARLAEDRILLAELGVPEAPAGRPVGPRRLVIAAENAAALEEIRPAIETRRAGGAVEVVVTSEDAHELAVLAERGDVLPIRADDPGLLEMIAGAEAFLCAYPHAPADGPRPGQWARSALFAGAPVVAASHPSLDGLAHLCVLDDWERGIELYGRFPAERLKAAALAQAEISGRIDPEALAGEWLAPASPRPPPARAAAAPTVLALIDIHQDLDVLLPVLEALRARGEVRPRMVLTDWLLKDSPRIPNTLRALGFDFAVHGREAVRKGLEPSLTGIDGVLSGADTNTRAHLAGHTLIGRARAAGLPTFTLQHGLENIGLTYKDHLHGEGIRFASETVFTWCAAGGLAEWVAEETRAKVVPVGSPKATPPPAASLELGQGHWARTVGVFENLHWHRFSELYLERVLEDLQAAAAALADTLFLVKPHHAGRWLSRNRGRLRERANLVVVDPTDSAWEPHTAPALIASVDAVLTTPSTVALDAARTGRPTAVFGYDLELPLYEPLPVVRGLQDLEAFLNMDTAEALRRNEAFLRRAVLPGRADHRIAGAIAEALRERRNARPARGRLFSA